MKMLYCKKCGTPVISDETLIQNIVDKLDEAQNKAHKANSTAEKNIYLHEAAEYKTMYKALMHNITQKEYAEAVIPYILREMLNTVKAKKLLTDAEIEAIYAAGKVNADKVAQQARKMERQLYGDFEAAYNRSKPDPTADRAAASW